MIWFSEDARCIAVWGDALADLAGLPTRAEALQQLTDFKAETCGKEAETTKPTEPVPTTSGEGCP